MIRTSDVKILNHGSSYLTTTTTTKWQSGSEITRVISTCKLFHIGHNKTHIKDNTTILHILRVFFNRCQRRSIINHGISFLSFFKKRVPRRRMGHDARASCPLALGMKEGPGIGVGRGVITAPNCPSYHNDGSKYDGLP